MKIAVNVLKMIGIAILVIIVLLAILIFLIFTAPMVPKDYTKTAETGGEIEAAYMAAGQYQVKHIEAEAPGDWKKFVAYYPADLEETETTFPVAVFVNGTGVGACWSRTATRTAYSIKRWTRTTSASPATPRAAWVYSMR